MEVHAAIALGSNLGDRAATLRGALRALGQAPGCRVVGASPLYETPPVGGPGGQPPFLNGAAVVATTLGPEPFLGLLHDVEADFGRVRTDHWGARTLDLDLLLHGESVVHHAGLRLPHPLFPLRKFVLAPLEAVAPLARHPTLGRTVAELLANLERRPSVVEIPGWCRVGRALPQALTDALCANDWVVIDPTAGPSQAAVSSTFRVLWEAAIRGGPFARDSSQGGWPPRLVLEGDDFAFALSETVLACQATRADVSRVASIP